MGQPLPSGACPVRSDEELMLKCPPRAPALGTGWIVFCAFCNCAGWVLSALHRLNATGYAIACMFGLAAIVICRKRIFPEGFRGLNLRKLRGRFRRLFPLGFLTLAALAILGGVLHGPRT